VEQAEGTGEVQSHNKDTFNSKIQAGRRGTLGNIQHRPTMTD